MTFDYKEFCKNLKLLRKANGYNKLQMSIQTDLQYQYYCNIENGNRIPNFRIVIAIANALNVSISELLNCTEAKENSLLEISILAKLRAVSGDREMLSKLHSVLLAVKTQGEKIERI